MKKMLKISQFVMMLLMSSLFVVQSAVAETATGMHKKQYGLAVDKVKADFAVMILGSGGPVASDNGRAGSSLLIFVEGKPTIVVDTGSGSFKSLALSGATLTDAHQFLFTHLHIDHTSDMSAMIKTLFFHRLSAGLLLPPAINFYGPDSNVPAYDPMSVYIDGHYEPATGVERYLHGFANAFFGGASPFVPLGHNLPFDTASDVITEVLYDHTGVLVKSIPVFHGGTPSVAYRIEYKGKSIVWTGDTNSSTDNIIKLSKKADVLIYDTAILENPTPEFLLMFHTTPTRIGEVAAASYPDKLILSHLSSITEDNIYAIKKTIKSQGYKGVILPAEDLQVINVW
jgi:ribonuclease BN (tRNA processing enzyme)